MHERGDVSLRGLAIGAAIIIAGIAASLALALAFVRPIEQPGAVQANPRLDLPAFRREKQARLASHGRVDEEHMHIPIERAMQLLANEGRR